MKRTFYLFNLILIMLCFSCSKTYKEESYSIYAMNTGVTITFYNEDNTQSLARDIESIYLKYDSVASDYSTGYGVKSVYDLNVERSVTATNELLELVNFALSMREDTQGYFEPLLGRLSKAWKESLAEGKLLADDFVSAELKIIEESAIVIEENKITIEGNADVDLGGIAKGYATEKVKEYLDSKNISNYLLNAGSSNIVLGSKCGESFKVGFEYPFSGDYYKILDLSNIAIGTSSMKHQHSLINNVYYSHLLNPKTGKPATYYEAISILGDNSAILDAYSTACFAMDLDQAKAFLAEKGYEWMALSGGELIHQSEGVAYE